MKRYLLCLLLWLAPCQGAERWELQYFYDRDDSSLTITDLVFPSATRGIATGYLTERDRTKPALLVTSDGGGNWTFIKFKRPGLSLFFLNESIGWIVTDKGIWKTAESGRSWRKIPKSPKDILRVHFLDENRGWAVGGGKSVWETADGGRRWKKVDAAEQVSASPEFTTFSWITFVGGRFGVVAGASLPPRRGATRFPDWMEPERAAGRREWPALNILLETQDGGATWKASSTSMFGRITRVRLAPDGRGLGLIEFLNAFEWPSEVFELEWQSGKNRRVFRTKDSAITDVAFVSGGPAFLAGYEPLGELARSPVPGRVRVFRSADLNDWREMEVDYRATARRVMLAAVDRDHVWAATDTGMILRLVTGAAR